MQMTLRWSQCIKILQISKENLQTMCNEVIKNCGSVLLDINRVSNHAVFKTDSPFLLFLGGRNLGSNVAHAFIPLSLLPLFFCSEFES